MAVSATNAYSVVLAGDIVGTLTIPGFNNGASPGQRVAIALTAGANTLTPPAGTRGLIIIGPTGSVNTKTLKGITGDTGIPIDPAGVTILALPSGPGTLVITSGGTETITIYWL